MNKRSDEGREKNRKEGSRTERDIGREERRKEERQGRERRRLRKREMKKEREEGGKWILMRFFLFMYNLYCCRIK